jgi:hypothetical protein
MKILTLILIIVLGGMFGILEYCEYIENPKSHFENYDEAKASGLMERGWIPTFIPKSSTEIREIHNIDTNRVRMTFKFSPGDTKEIIKNCITEKETKDASQFKCKYFGNNIRVVLNSDGTGELESKPN